MKHSQKRRVRRVFFQEEGEDEEEVEEAMEG